MRLVSRQPEIARDNEHRDGCQGGGNLMLRGLSSMEESSSGDGAAAGLGVCRQGFPKGRHDSGGHRCEVDSMKVMR